MSLGRVAGLTTWAVKSMGGGRAHDQVAADATGLAADRLDALVDRRPGREGTVLSARSVPGVLRWSADPQAGEPRVTGPDGRTWSWSEPGLAEALSADLGLPVGLAHDEGGHADLPRSVLVTTAASHREVERQTGGRLEPARWRTNLHLDLDLPAYAEDGWEGARLVVGDVVLRLLHPCQRCTIPTYAPGGLRRDPGLLRFFAAERQGPFGINARVEVPGVLRAGDPVGLEPAGP